MSSGRTLARELRSSDSRAGKVYRALVAAAQSGARAPYDWELAQMLGSSSTSVPNGIVSRLEGRGVIRVRKVRRVRVVEIIELQKATSAPDFIEERRDDRERRDNRLSARTFMQGRVVDRRTFQRLDRSPCQLCGVRGDIGCRHQPASAPIEVIL